MTFKVTIVMIYLHIHFYPLQDRFGHSFVHSVVTLCPEMHLQRSQIGVKCMLLAERETDKFVTRRMPYLMQSFQDKSWVIAE